MDTVSDILSSFFVSKKVSTKKSKTIKQQKNVITEPEPQPETIQEPQPETVPEPQIKEQETQTIQNEIPEILQSEKLEEEKDTSTTDASEATFTESESSEESVHFEPKKYVLRAMDLSKKNIMIINTDMKENISMLSDLLHNLSLMKNAQEYYNSTVYIVCSAEWKKFFRKIILDNPYLYFTDFVIKSSLSKQMVKSIGESEKKTIVVFQNVDELKDDIKTSNVQLMLLIADYKLDIKDLYDALGGSKLVLHKRDTLKSLQKLFFNRFIKTICKDDITFDYYYHLVNKENFGIKYIILKDNELRYY